MVQDSHDEARARLAPLAARADVNEPGVCWEAARRLEQDATLLGKVLLAASRTGRTGTAVADAAEPEPTVEELGAALGLFEQMRTQLDRLETQVVMEARRRGMDWKHIAPHQGLGSSQAASQRYQRLMTRLEEIRQGVR